MFVCLTIQWSLSTMNTKVLWSRHILVVLFLFRKASSLSKHLKYSFTLKSTY